MNRVRTIDCLIISTLATVCSAPMAAGGQVSQHVLKEREFTSPSGSYVLRYVPTDKLGAGSAGYQLRKGDKEIWRGEKSLSLWDILVTDDGIVCGYAYSRGSRGVGDLHLVIINRDGKYLLDDAISRRPHQFLSAVAQPRCSGLLHDPAGKRIAFRVRDEQSEEWWVYNLSTGKSVARFRCRDALQSGKDCGYLFDAVAIRDTPFVLVRFAPCNRTHASSGLAVFDYTGNVLWMYELSHDDRSALFDGEFARRPRGWVKILPMEEAGRFSVRLVPDKHDVAFQVTRDDKGEWRVRRIESSKSDTKPTPER